MPAPYNPPSSNWITQAEVGPDDNEYHEPQHASGGVGTDLLPPPMLKLFFNSHARFTRGGVSPSTLSKEYLQSIRSCSSELLQYDPESYGKLAEEVQYVSEVWSFVHAILLSDIDDRQNDLSFFLSHWFREAYPGQPVYAELLSSDELDSSSTIWAQLIEKVIYGGFKEARTILEEATRQWQMDDDDDWKQAMAAIKVDRLDEIPRNISPFTLMDTVLSSAPQFTVAARADGSWSAWQQCCARLAHLNAQNDDNESNLSIANMLLILSGHDEEMERACTTWQQMLVAYALFGRDQTTGIGTTGISTACEFASSAFEVPTDVSGPAILYAARGNIEQLITHLRDKLSTPFFAAHLCDLLVQTGKLPDVLVDDDETDENGNDLNSGEAGAPTAMPPMSLRESCFIRYVNSLRKPQHFDSFWRIAVDYCHVCPMRGPKLLVDLLKTVPLSDAKTAEKLLRVCHKRGLTKLYNKTCERMAVSTKYLSPSSKQQQSGSMPSGASLMWFARAKRRDKCIEVARMAVKYAERGGPHSPGARDLEGVSCAIEACNELSIRRVLDYAVLYYAMQEARSKIQHAADNEESGVFVKDFVQAVKSLIAQDGAHREFWAVIAYETAKVLHLYPNSVPLFPRQVLLDVVASLELVSGPYVPPEMHESLRIRISCDTQANSISNASADDAPVIPQDAAIEPCELETMHLTLDHCRTVLLQSLAKRINDS